MSHYICTGGCGGASDDANAVCQTESCPMYMHKMVVCNCKDGKHKKVLEAANAKGQKEEKTLNE